MQAEQIYADIDTICTVVEKSANPSDETLTSCYHHLNALANELDRRTNVFTLGQLGGVAAYIKLMGYHRIATDNARIFDMAINSRLL